MGSDEPLVRNISDTAAWVAEYRAQETARPDALFRDPFAARLAGDRGRRIAEEMAGSRKHPWAFVIRTVLIDDFISQLVREGADTVLNLAAGLDTRPYRMELPPELRWIEVDLPPLLEYKQQILTGESPKCRLEQIALDLSDVKSRRSLFEQVGRESRRVAVLTEGLLIYLTEDAVSGLAADLAGVPTFQNWVMDLTSPTLLTMLQKQYRENLAGANAHLQWAPEEGVDFFRPFGWRCVAARGLLKAAAKAGRLNWLLRLAAMLPDSGGRKSRRPWGGICLFEREPPPKRQ